MLEIASQMIICLLVAALLGFIIGYLFGKMTCANDECGHTEPSHDGVVPLHSTDIQHHTENNTTPSSTTLKGEDSLEKTISSKRNNAEYLEKSAPVDTNDNVTSHDKHTSYASKTEKTSIDTASQTKDIVSDNHKNSTNPTDKTDTSMQKDDKTDNSNKDTQSAPLSSPRNGEKDNLSRIKGIGMKLEESLNNIGIYHFDQIATWNEKDIAWADETLGFPGRVERENWIEQAKLLAAGEETEFSKRVDAGKVESSK